MVKSAPDVYDALMTHPKFKKNFGNAPVEEISISTRIFTRSNRENLKGSI